jgi:hypothetical protein
MRRDFIPASRLVGFFKTRGQRADGLRPDGHGGVAVVRSSLAAGGVEAGSEVTYNTLRNIPSADP